MLRFFFIFCAVSYFFVRSSFAGPAMFYGINHQYQAPRYMGMGNAGVAVANDESAMFYNPAGAQQLETWKFNGYLVRAGLDPDIKDFIDDIDDAGDTAQAISDVLVANYGKHFSAQNVGLLGSILATPKWSAAILPVTANVDLALHNSVGPSVNVYGVLDTTIAYSRAWQHKKGIKRGRLDMGATAKVINRAEIDKIVDIAAIQNDKLIDWEDANEGLTIDFDYGAMWHLPDDREGGFWGWAQPTTVGFVMRNILDYGFLTEEGIWSKSKNGEPEKLHRVIDIGTAYKLPQWWVFDSTLAVDVRDILHPNWTYNKGIHIGAEFNWELSSWWKGGWRVGLNQLYWTAGFTGQIWAFRLDLSTYGREVGTKSNRVEDRVWMLSMSLDI